MHYRLYSRSQLLLAALFFFVIGTFWLLGSLQEPIFYHLVGRQYHPHVNVVSFILIVPLLIGYMAGLNRWQPQRLLRGVASFYSLFFIGSAFLLTVPGVGLPGAVPSVSNVLGWCIFAGIKAYGSLMVTLFWTYATSITSIDEAKTLFPFIVMCAQLGSLAGVTLVRTCAHWGVPLLVFIGGVGILLMMVILLFLSPDGRASTQQSPSAGLLEGLLLFLQRPYLRGVFVVSTGYLIITALFDYQMHYLAHQQYATIEQFAWFKGVYGQLVNGGTLLLSCGVTSWLLRVLGVARCLLLYPLLTIGCIALAWWWPTLWTIAGIMVALRVFSLGLNNPTKEIVYIPEDESVRYKVKGWIDVVGYRAAFALGSYVPTLIGEPYSLLVNAGAGISFIITVVWGYYAWLVGKHFSKSTRSDDVC